MLICWGAACVNLSFFAMLLCEVLELPLHVVLSLLVSARCTSVTKDPELFLCRSFICSIKQLLSNIWRFLKLDDSLQRAQRLNLVLSTFYWIVISLCPSVFISVRVLRYAMLTVIHPTPTGRDVSFHQEIIPINIFPYKLHCYTDAF